MSWRSCSPLSLVGIELGCNDTEGVKLGADDAEGADDIDGSWDLNRGIRSAKALSNFRRSLNIQTPERHSLSYLQGLPSLIRPLVLGNSEG